MSEPSTLREPGDAPDPATIVRTLMTEQRFLFRGGYGISVEDYIDRHPFLAQDPGALLDLVRNEISLRGEGGEHATLDDYRSRFPGLESSLSDLFSAPETAPGPPDDLPSTDPAPPTRPATPAPADPWWPALDGYEVRGVLGQGGMGIVYLARDLRRGVDVAVKTIRNVDAAAVSRFKREFRSLQDLSHPNLVALHELISDGHTWFIVMEYVAGRTFLDHIRQDTGPKAPAAPIGPDPATRARLRGAFRQLAEGLMAVHARGKLHRDIKPSNVLVTPEGRVVLMDFGLVTGGDDDSRSRSTGGGGVVGTPAYMAPEQATGVGTTEASDWYSVGVMLYEALTGRLPFLGGMLQILIDKQRFEPPPPRELAPDLPGDLDVLCEELLRRDPHQRPTGAAILGRLGGPSPDSGDDSRPSSEPRSSRGSDSIFVGRAAHRAALEDAFAALGRGRPVAVFLRGTSGVGKSSLVRRFLDGLGGDALALAGRCHERESVPYKALDGLIESLAQHLRRLPPDELHAALPRDVAALARVFPVLRRVEAIRNAPGRGTDIPDPQELRRRSYAALREMLARIGDRRPLVLWIDDLQWGDPDSLPVLSEVLRPPDPPVLLLLCGFRSEEVEASPFLRGLLADPWEGVDCRHLEVGPMAAAEASVLARQMLGDSATERQVAAIARESGGNPFFVAELARSLQAGGPDLAEGAPATPITLDDVLWSRIRRLPDDALRMLQAVAVSGGPLSPSVAWRSLGLAGDERAALAVLRAGRMIRAAGGPASPDGERVETYHDRIREAVVARLAPEDLTACHRRLAQALEAVAGSDFEALGVHFRGAGEPEKAGAYFARAAEGAARALAFDRAAKLYRLAIELLPMGREQERGIRVALGEALANAGRGADAAREFLAACDGATVAEALELRRKAAMQLLISGHIDRGLETLRDVLAAVGLSLPATPRRSLISLVIHRGLLRLRGLRFRPRDTSEVAASDLTRIDVCWSAGIGLSNVDWVRGADFQTRGLLLALRAGEPRRIGRALSVEAAQSATGGLATRARTARLLAQAEALSEGDNHPYDPGMVILARGVSSYLEGRWADAVEHCDRADALFRDRYTGVAWERDTAHAYALWGLSHLGRWGELSRRFPVLIAEARERGDLYAEMNLSTYILAIVRIGADRPGEAREEIRRVMSHWSGDGYHVQHNDQVWATILLDLYEGDGPSAWRAIVGHWPTLSRSLLLQVQFIRVAMYGLRARCALAAAGRASDPNGGPWLRSAARDAARLDREGTPWAIAQARLARAGIAALRGRADLVPNLLREARDRFRAADMEICAAVADLRLGETLDDDALRQEAHARLVDRSARRPSRVADLFAPGFGRPDRPELGVIPSPPNAFDQGPRER
ncbi:serine/threonine-protein kinase PknK [Tundrisphaera sp. TA3]|uniref:serine/threonine-protein kinase n=1 Tax=Tundrisphaera sp. TA3 TaxID=3435775 RepID=UPI003EB9E98B